MRRAFRAVLLIMVAVVAVGMVALLLRTVLQAPASIRMQADMEEQGSPVARVHVEPTPAGQPPQVIAAIPQFQLTDQTGQTYGLDNLLGKVWVADFIFTRCQGPCPIMTARMADLQRDLSAGPQWNDVRLVSFSVDPDYDSPAVLREYAARFQADPDHWKFLTGHRQVIWDLSRYGFLLPVGDEPGNPQMPIFHSQRMALVDRQGQLRGVYDAMQDDDLAKLRGDLLLVLAETNPPPAPAPLPLPASPSEPATQPATAPEPD